MPRQRRCATAVASLEPGTVRRDLRLHNGKIICVDATRIAFETPSRLNMPLLAVLAHELGFPDEAMRDRITHQWPRVSMSHNLG